MAAPVPSKGQGVEEEIPDQRYQGQAERSRAPTTAARALPAR
jgi:hypothetical protein